jgi:hypothetical protein
MNKTIEILNLQQTVLIEIVDRKECWIYRYLPFKKSIWGNTEEGFYSWDGYSEFFTKEELESGNNRYNLCFIVENNIVYFQPKVVLHMSDQSSNRTFYDTFEEARNNGQAIADRLAMTYTLK